MISVLSKVFQVLKYPKMEVSRRRVLQKHLEPARPLRRVPHFETGALSEVDEATGRLDGNLFSCSCALLAISLEPKTNAATCAQAVEDQLISQVGRTSEAPRVGANPLLKSNELTSPPPHPQLHLNVCDRQLLDLSS